MFTRALKLVSSRSLFSDHLRPSPAAALRFPTVSFSSSTDTSPQQEPEIAINNSVPDPSPTVSISIDRSRPCNPPDHCNGSTQDFELVKHLRSIIKKRKDAFLDAAIQETITSPEDFPKRKSEADVSGSITDKVTGQEPSSATGKEETTLGPVDTSRKDDGSTIDSDTKSANLSSEKVESVSVQQDEKKIKGQGKTSLVKDNVSLHLEKSARPLRLPNSVKSLWVAGLKFGGQRIKFIDNAEDQILVQYLEVFQSHILLQASEAAHIVIIQVFVFVVWDRQTLVTEHEVEISSLLAQVNQLRSEIEQIQPRNPGLKNALDPDPVMKNALDSDPVTPRSR